MKQRQRRLRWTSAIGTTPIFWLDTVSEKGRFGAFGGHS